MTKDDGFLVIDIGSHASRWQDPAAANADAKVFVPIWSNDKAWGSVEILFQPLKHAGWFGFMYSPYAKMIMFISATSVLSFLFYLKRTLQHLDPSKVVPPHVRAVPDTLAEGLLIMDQEGRIALANRAFAQVVGKEPEALMGSRASAMAWEQDISQGVTSTIEFPWSLAVQENKPQRNFTLHLKDATGVRRTFIVNCSPVAGARQSTRGAGGLRGHRTR